MEHHFDCALRLNTEPKHKSLYSWAINEVDGNGHVIGRDQIPWEWTLYFSATSCVLTNRFEIERPFLGDESEPPKIEAGQIIRMKLEPGVRVDGEIADSINFSMFGTKRYINGFFLEVRLLDDPDKLEYCTAWGCVSYTSEIDFRDETVDDVLWFYLYVKPKTFARYVAMIEQKAIDEITFGVGLVDGIYSDWSPSISTRDVKVLARDSEQNLHVPPDFDGKLPRLGRVRAARLNMDRRLAFESAPQPVPEEEKQEDLSAPENPTFEVTSQMDPRLLPVLTSLMRAAWAAVAILVLIATISVFR